MSDRLVDLVEEDFDAVLRTGEIRDQRLIARGELQPILTEFSPPVHRLSLVHQPSKLHSAKLRVFKEALLAAWGEASAPSCRLEKARDRK